MTFNLLLFKKIKLLKKILRPLPELSSFFRVQEMIIVHKKPSLKDVICSSDTTLKYSSNPELYPSIYIYNKFKGVTQNHVANNITVENLCVSEVH